MGNTRSWVTGTASSVEPVQYIGGLLKIDTKSVRVASLYSLM